MSDVAEVIPSFPIGSFSHLIPALERNNITTADVLNLDAKDVARTAKLPLHDVRYFVNTVIELLYGDAAASRHTHRCHLASSVASPVSISLLDDVLDQRIGQIRPGYISEITGESGVGKTQVLLTLLLAVQLPAPWGLKKKALYITTESALQTTRLVGLIEKHPIIATLPPADQPQLSGILSIKCPDVQSQEHIIRYQLPVVVKRQNIGLVVIDSITANYRAEMDKLSGPDLAHRSASLQEMGHILRRTATDCECAIVVANQVGDRFEGDKVQYDRAVPFPSSADSDPGTVSTNTPAMQLDHQQRWFTGWGDDEDMSRNFNLKTPSLGMIWTNQISCRISLQKAKYQKGQGASTVTRRRMKLVFAPWNASGVEVDFEIKPEGLNAVLLEKGKSADKLHLNIEDNAR